MKKKLIKKAGGIAALAVLLIVMLLLKSNTAVAEFFARTVSRAWIWFTGHVFGWIPVSLYEILLISVILAGLICIVIMIIRLFRKKKLKSLNMFLCIMIIGLAFGNVYMVSGSMAYNRVPPPVPAYGRAVDGELSKETFVALAERMVSNLNELSAKQERDENGNVVSPYTLNELSKVLAKDFEILDNSYYSSYTPPAKRILNKTIMSEMQIGGIFFAPFGEITVNVNEFDCSMPISVAHEIAHSKGVMEENEANLIAAYVTILSSDDYVRYCGYYYTYSTVLSALSYMPDTSEEVSRLRSSVDPDVIRERNNEGLFWSEFTLLDSVSEFFNDIYLRLSGSPEGTGSYGDYPEITEIPDAKDSDGKPVYIIVSYSKIQSLIIKLYLEGEI